MNDFIQWKTVNHDATMMPDSQIEINGHNTTRALRQATQS